MAVAARTKDSVALAPSQVLRVYGMRRSGNHALIDWMLRNAPGGNGLFLNNCRPGRDPLQSTRGISVYRDGSEVAADGLDAKLAAAGPAPFTVVSYEDTMPAQDRKPLYEAAETCVIIYRSFLQWSASLLRKIQGNPGYGPLERGRVMMNALRTYQTMLDRVRDRDVVPLLYDDWMAGDDYRADTLGSIGLPGRDLSRGTVQRYGGGSSFQGKAADVTELATDRRSAQMADDLEYQLLMWTTARDLGFMERLADVFPRDAERLSALLDAAHAKVILP
jgi:hypothetical protein